MSKKCVLAGCSGRGLMMYALPICNGEMQGVTLNGIYDPYKTRATEFSKKCGNVTIFDNFDKMLEQVQPDLVIVTTIDAYHHEYIIKSLEKGIDVITEKPMTIDREKAKMIMEAEKKSGKHVYMAFNLRFALFQEKIKILLMNKIIGDIKHVHFEWFLDKSHGADYFRRWHRYMKNSGGLLIHKSTHHFDLINWWLGKKPISVFARGKLKVYGKNGKFRGINCRTCEYAQQCPYYFDLLNKENKSIVSMHIQSEGETKYLRDSCIFADDIDIYDTMSVNVNYEDGITLNYSLTAYNPYEGWKISIIGEKGRIEACEDGCYAKDKNTIKVFRENEEYIKYIYPRITDGHGGGDGRMRNGIFLGADKDPYCQFATSYDGYLSLAIGDCANLSIKTGKEERI